MNQKASILLDDQETVAIEIYTNLSHDELSITTHIPSISDNIMSAIFYE